MTAKQALLIEIDVPGSETLRLMSGQGFEVLRTDRTGREIYGLAHAGKEYLFFPFSFKPVDAGVLSVHLPAEYEESCLDHTADGARIVFASTHGTPFFAEMPPEYHSNTGVLRVDPSGGVRVLLDKLEPGRLHHDACGCGHEHGHAGHAAHEQEAPCGCHAHEDGMNDKDLALLVRETCADLNKALQAASAAGLLVEMEIEDDSGSHRLRVSRIARLL